MNTARKGKRSGAKERPSEEGFLVEEWSRAIRVYRKEPTLGEEASLYNGLGYCFARLGYLREAERNSRPAVPLAPHEAVYANDLGYALTVAARCTCLVK